ncbi:PREDICTED: interferon regulatory factor 4 [Mandrillus leucophaeus]|uniref:interferon regulatory factor 4 n=1 Tax=Mandrillus leucophaeus TaxID=9568 RepID=UPI0005F4D542|nr:PREDICTED: interferon regulatory factor 4 [Mandrillus leucophaeus]
MGEYIARPLVSERRLHSQQAAAGGQVRMEVLRLLCVPARELAQHGREHDTSERREVLPGFFLEGWQEEEAKREELFVNRERRRLRLVSLTSHREEDEVREDFLAHTDLTSDASARVKNAPSYDSLRSEADAEIVLPKAANPCAWALFKGKFREGIDKPDPPTWKTRLRCALNKSNDFEELVERSQLDISDPYKVYRIVPEGAKKGAKQLTLEDPQMSMSHPYTMTTPYPSLPAQQVHNYVMPPLDRSWRDYVPDQPHPEIPYQCPVTFGPRGHHWQGPACENGCQVTGTFYACAPPESQAPGIPTEPSIRSAEALALSDCRLHICLYYREILVKELTTSSPEGCRISHGHTYDASNLDQVLFPYPEDNGQRKNIEKLLGHLERGVVLWMAPDGLYAKRLCQSRIYWDGPLALCSDRPNKLERDQTCKLFDTQQFLSGEALHSVRTEVVMAHLPQGSETTGSLSPQAEVFLLLTPEPTGLGAWPQ